MRSTTVIGRLEVREGQGHPIELVIYRSPLDMTLGNEIECIELTNSQIAEYVVHRGIKPVVVDDMHKPI